MAYYSQLATAPTSLSLLTLTHSISLSVPKRTANTSWAGEGAHLLMSTHKGNGDFLERKAEIKAEMKMRDLFSRHKEGTRVSEVMHYSVTKEFIAQVIAQKAYSKGYETVVDGCGGCGGNSIQFAEAGLYVALVELDKDTIADAEHNAKVYGVDQWIKMYNENVLQFDCRNTANFDPAETLLFASPEWGGPSYKSDEIFDLEHLNPPLSQLLAYAKRQGFKETCVYVPRTSNIIQAEELGCYHCEYMFLRSWCNAICLWFRTA